MALNPSIILQPAANPVQLQSPVDTFAKMLSLRELMARASGAELAQKQQQQAYNDNQSLRQLFASNPAPTAQQIYSAAGPAQGTAVLRGMNEAQMAAGNLAKLRGDLANQENDFLGKVAGSVRANNYSPESIQQAFQLATNAGYGQHVQQIAAQIQANPASAKQIFDGLYQSSMSAKDQAAAQTAALTEQVKAEAAKEQARHNVANEQQAANTALETARNNAFNNKAKALEIQQGNVRNRISQQEANVAAKRADIEKARYGLDASMMGTAGPAATGDAALQGLSPAMIAQVKAIADYKQPPYTRSTGVGPSIMAKVHQYFPEYDATQYGAVNALRKDFTSGKSAQSMNALNTAIGHLGELKDSYDQLHNTGSIPFNELANWVKSKTDNGPLAAVNTNANGVALEINKAYGGNAEGEVNAWRGSASNDAGPQQQKAVIGKAVTMLGKKIMAYRDQWNKTPLGKKGDFPVLSPQSKATLVKLGYDPNTLEPMSASTTVKMQAPDGSFATVSAADVDHYTKLGAKVVQ